MAALLASMLHVITGPDHLAAVTPFVVRAKRSAWKVGLLWSVGHLFGMLVLGLLFYWLREALPVEEISIYAERLVGIVILGIGISVLYNLLKRDKKHRHLHVHSDKPPIIHSHSHDHKDQPDHHHYHDPNNRHGLIPSFSIGVLHGIAGIGHLFLFLPVLGFQSEAEGINYVIGFTTGIIAAMVLYSIIIGRVSTIAGDSHQNIFFSGIRLSAGLFAIIIGLYWILIN
ncbi:MAG: hypothetical protein HKN00_11690 [Flavobacteriaceae bacterium]|nr:hypothetical protein [Bacteroidia bacterium]MBT8288054.1 hypothetical protein [Bacteroidia bacterium]NNF75840.1 hypothetical protein [Flavobacteriaceae bacterium]